MDMYKQGRIIKSQDISFVSNGAGMPTDFIPFALQDKKGPPEKSNQIQEIERILQETKQKIAEARQQGYAQGFSEGVKEGSETQKNEVVTVMNTLQGLMKEVGSFKEKTLEASEKQLLNLCFSIAEMVIHQEVSTEKSVILSVLKAAFRNIVDRENIKVRLNPRDFQYMIEMKSDFINSMDGVRNVFFEEDGSISHGGAVIETSSGEVDARINEQLKEIKGGLMSLQAS